MEKAAAHIVLMLIWVVVGFIIARRKRWYI